MEPEDEQRYKRQVAEELNSAEYPSVEEAHVLDDGRLVAFLSSEGAKSSLSAVLPAHVTLEATGNGSVELGLDERWAPVRLD